MNDMESFMGDLSACETMIMKVIWDLLQQQLEFWFDGKPSAFLSAWCEKNKLSREEADRIREIIEKE